MPDQLQLRGGDTASNSTFTGAQRELSVDTQTNTLILHDGVTPGGHRIASTAAPDFTGNVDIGGNLDVGGSASFAGILNVTTTKGGDNVAAFESSGSNSYGLKVKAGGEGDANYFADFRRQDNSSVFKINGNGSVAADGDVKIGGTLPSSPNITLNANGNANFQTGSTNEEVNVDFSGDNNRIYIVDPAGGDRDVFQVYAGGSIAANQRFAITNNGDVHLGGSAFGTNTYNISLNADGSATFAGSVQSGPYVANQNGSIFGCYLDQGGTYYSNVSGADDYNWIARRNGTIYSSIKSDGSADFAGNIDVNGSIILEANTGNVYATGTFYKNWVGGSSGTPLLAADDAVLWKEPDNPANFNAEGEYTGPTLDVKERLTKADNALKALKTAAALASDFATLKAAIATALTDI